MAVPGYMVDRLGTESGDGTATFSFRGEDIVLSAAEVGAVRRATSFRTGIYSQAVGLPSRRSPDHYFAGARC